MEILSRGNDPAKRQYTGTCTTCGTRVRFLKQEAKYHSDQRDGDYLSVKCPECPASIYVNARAGVAF